MLDGIPFGSAGGVMRDVYKRQLCHRHVPASQPENNSRAEHSLLFPRTASSVHRIGSGQFRLHCYQGRGCLLYTSPPTQYPPMRSQQLQAPDRVTQTPLPPVPATQQPPLQEAACTSGGAMASAEAPIEAAISAIFAISLPNVDFEKMCIRDSQKTCREHQHGPCGKSRRSRCERDRSGQEGNQVFGEGHRVHASARSGQEVHIQDRN